MAKCTALKDHVTCKSRRGHLKNRPIFANANPVAAMKAFRQFLDPLVIVFFSPLLCFCHLDVLLTGERKKTFLSLAKNHNKLKKKTFLLDQTKSEGSFACLLAWQR